MNRFAELLDRLAYEPGRNNKLRLITAYFRDVEDPDRGYALAALTGALSFKHAKPGLIRDLIADRTDPVLFALSYDYVGDLSETVALMWPKGAFNREQSLLGHPSPQPSPASGRGSRLSRGESLRPHQRHRFREIADIIIRQSKQHGIGAIRDQVADQSGLGVLERQCAGERRQRIAAIGVWGLVKIAGDQP